MPYRQADWDDAFLDEMRQTHDEWGNTMFWWGLDQWRTAHDRPGTNVEVAGVYLDEYWLPHYHLDQPELMATRAVELIFPNAPEPGPNPVRLTDEVRDRGQGLF
jgi:hypothetical protein